MADFGIADYCEEGETLDEDVGTLQYMAPEVLEHKEYSFPVDIWGAGLVFYELIMGQSLFKLQEKQDILDQIYAINADKKRFSTIEISQQKLLKCLLQIMPKKRPTASQILRHSFFDNVRE